MTLSLGKITAICFAGSILLMGASVLTSQTASSSQAPSQAADTSQSQTTPPSSTNSNGASTSTAAAPAQASTTPLDPWPAGPGKDIFLQTCSSCHGPETVIGHNLDVSGWTDVLNQMIQNGAQGSNDDFSAILQYLVTNFGPMPAKVNINKATAMNLRSWLGMPEKEAEAIAAYRQQHGDFKTLDDLKKVPGVDANYIDSEKNLLTFSDSAAGTAGH
ncbi:MAG TPA: helix-hairpin-helix domain-containing protein [Candidatus Binatia bacterium]|nr:helix-hairpin-helix domain-containing protein [Candidatus Binatia bacterium]